MLIKRWSDKQAIPRGWSKFKTRHLLRGTWMQMISSNLYLEKSTDNRSLAVPLAQVIFGLQGGLYSFSVPGDRADMRAIDPHWLPDYHGTSLDRSTQCQSLRHLCCSLWRIQYHQICWNYCRILYIARQIFSNWVLVKLKQVNFPYKMFPSFAVCSKWITHIILLNVQWVKCV